jgi:hypothetical protein
MFLDRAFIAAIGETGCRESVPRVARNGADASARAMRLRNGAVGHAAFGKTKPTGKVLRFQRPLVACATQGASENHAWAWRALRL